MVVQLTGLNLLGEDITPSTVIKYVVEVHKYFWNHHAPLACLKEYSEYVLPPLLGSTKCSNLLICLETFEWNHNSYIKASIDPL